MKILGLCGSLRKQSRSLALLQATSLLAAAPLEFRIFEGLGKLPLFNPDLENAVPAPVRTLWDAIDACDIVVIATPEYAHGVTGTIKNTLDWLVGYVPFTGKPVVVFNPSHRAEHADLALKEILTTMNAHLIDEACLRIPVCNCQLSAIELSGANAFSIPIQTALEAMHRHIKLAT